MNIFPRFPRTPMGFSPLYWPHWIFVTSVLLFVDIEPVMTILPTQAKDVEVGKPTIQKPVKPKVLEEKLENLPVAEPWKPGDPIRVRPDLKRSVDPPVDDPTPSTNMDKDPRDQSTEKPVTDKKLDDPIQGE